MGDFNLRNTTTEIAKILTYFNDTAEEFSAYPRADASPDGDSIEIPAPTKNVKGVLPASRSRILS